MNSLEILCQPPVLSALVPHLDTATARALFSSTRRLHTSLKTSAGLRAAVWKLRLGAQPHKNPYYVQAMMRRVGAVGDLSALRLLAEDIKSLAARNPEYSTSKRRCMAQFYWIPLNNALSGAAHAGHFAVVEILVHERLAALSVGTMIYAIRSANIALVKYLLDFHPAIGASAFTSLDLHDNNGGVVLTNAKMLHISSNLLEEYNAVDDPTEDHLIIHRMLNS